MWPKVSSSSEGLDVSHLFSPLGKAPQLKVACSDLASSPLYTAFLWFSASTRGSTCYIETLALKFVVAGLFFTVRCRWERA